MHTTAYASHIHLRHGRSSILKLRLQTVKARLLDGYHAVVGLAAREVGQIVMDPLLWDACICALNDFAALGADGCASSLAGHRMREPEMSCLQKISVRDSRKPATMG